MTTKLSLQRKSSLRPRRSGFTLVEVVLAMGVASFGLISMMGLLTVGLKTFHEAINATSQAGIAQQVANQLQLAKYSVLSAKTSQTVFYFTQDGLPTTDVTTEFYTATVSAPTALATSGSTALPSENTLTFTVSIQSAGSSQVINALPIQIANNGS